MNKKIITCLLYYFILPLLLAALLIGAFFVTTVTWPGDVFRSSYQSMIQDKYDILVNTKSPKIILVGGSSLGFGMEEELLSEKLGYPVVNLGLHAGFGQLFNSEIAKANIGEGDIVVLAYEYDWFNHRSFEKIGVDLVMSALDARLDMYKIIPMSQWPAVIGYLPQHAMTKANFLPQSGPYSRDAFDDSAHMTYQREFALADYEARKETLGDVFLAGAHFDPVSVAYVREFGEFIRSRGAQVCFTAPPVYEAAKTSDDESFRAYRAKVEELTGIPYISDPLDYVFPAEYMFDTIYHCSSLGQVRRTELLAEDLMNFLH